MIRLNQTSSKRLYYLITIALFVGGFIFWVSDLRSDPPMYFSGLGQSLSTDPAQYFHHARNKILFGEFNPDGYDRWTVYQHSLISGLCYLWFSLTEVSLMQASLASTVLSFLSLLLLILTANKFSRPWVGASIALMFIINLTLFTHGRITYLENGLIFLSALLLYVYSRWEKSSYGLIACGAIVALAVITGKLFGLLLLPALLLTIITSKEKTKFKKMVLTSSAFLVSSVLLILILYGNNMGAAFGYASEQSYGLRGFPEGLATPWGFVEHFISYGMENHLYYNNPDLFLFFVLSVLSIIIYLARGSKLSSLAPHVRLSIFGSLLFLLGLMPLNYSPIRYAIVIIPLLIFSCFTLLDKLHQTKKSARFTFTKPVLILSGLIIWISAFHLIGNIFFFNQIPFPYAELTWFTLPIALLGVYGLYLLNLRKKAAIFPKKTFGYLIVATLLFSVVTNSFRIKRIHYSESNFNIEEANLDIEQILSKDAMVSGPYAAVLTANTNLRSFIHLFGVASVDTTLFDRYPITHLAVDESNWADAVKSYPKLKDIIPITTYWIRDYEVRLYNITNLFSNEKANSYKESYFEIASSKFYQNDNNGALELSKQFLSDNIDSKSGNVLLIDILSALGNPQEVFDKITRLADRFPTDFYIQIQCGRFLQILALERQDNSLLELAKRYYERGTKVNRFRGDYANNLYTQTIRQFTTTKQVNEN